MAQKLMVLYARRELQIILMKFAAVDDGAVDAAPAASVSTITYEEFMGKIREEVLVE